MLFRSDYSIYGTPLESTTYKFAKCLQKRFGIIEGVTDKNYITNSYHVHVTEPIDAFDKLRLEAKFQKLSPGGAISYVEVPDMQNNLDAVLGVNQTVYAKDEGSAAAPTAGLHFTTELLGKLKAKGVAIAPVMLHVGLGTFRPVKADRLDEHVMHTEFFSVSKESAEIINSRRAAGGRVICVGTTSCRTLESASDENGIVHAMSADTGIFIYPGYKFKAVDALITNFHLPQSTLIMLISAFYNREKVMEAYKTAVEEKYRFFSFGDAMFIQ